MGHRQAEGESLREEGSRELDARECFERRTRGGEARKWYLLLVDCWVERGALVSREERVGGMMDGFDLFASPKWSRCNEFNPSILVRSCGVRNFFIQHKIDTRVEPNDFWGGETDSTRTEESALASQTTPGLMRVLRTLRFIIGGEESCGDEQQSSWRGGAIRLSFRFTTLLPYNDCYDQLKLSSSTGTADIDSSLMHSNLVSGAPALPPSSIFDLLVSAPTATLSCTFHSRLRSIANHVSRISKDFVEVRFESCAGERDERLVSGLCDQRSLGQLSAMNGDEDVNNLRRDSNYGR